MFGISAALTTPYHDDGALDFARLDAHLKTVLTEGCSSVTLFGTTGEGASVSSKTRLDTLRAVVGGNVSPEKLILTLHGTAVSDIVDQAKFALDLGVQRFLLPPPCYFNQPSNAGLFDWFGSILSQLDGTSAQIILYHIPQVIGVGLPIDLVAQLKAAFPSVVFGVKDSSGSFENTKELLRLPGLNILVGDERLLASVSKLGAAGSISGIANLFSGRLAQVLATGVDDQAINQLIDTVLEFPVTPAIKSLVAHRYGADEWRRTRAPLERITDQDYATLCNAYDAVGDVA